VPQAVHLEGLALFAGGDDQGELGGQVFAADQRLPLDEAILDVQPEAGQTRRTWAAGLASPFPFS
jgi:hypothetical protein